MAMMMKNWALGWVVAMLAAACSGPPDLDQDDLFGPATIVYVSPSDLEARGIQAMPAAARGDTGTDAQTIEKVQVLPALYGHDRGILSGDNRCDFYNLVGDCQLPGSKEFLVENKVNVTPGMRNNVSLQINEYGLYLSNRGWDVDLATGQGHNWVVEGTPSGTRLASVTKAFLEGDASCETINGDRLCYWFYCDVVISPSRIEAATANMLPNERGNFVGNLVLNHLFQCAGLGVHGSNILMTRDPAFAWRNGTLFPDSDESQRLLWYEP